MRDPAFAIGISIVSLFVFLSAYRWKKLRLPYFSLLSLAFLGGLLLNSQMENIPRIVLAAYTIMMLFSVVRERRKNKDSKTLALVYIGLFSFAGLLAPLYFIDNNNAQQDQIKQHLDAEMGAVRWPENKTQVLAPPRDLIGLLSNKKGEGKVIIAELSKDTRTQISSFHWELPEQCRATDVKSARWIVLIREQMVDHPTARLTKVNRSGETLSAEPVKVIQWDIDILDTQNQTATTTPLTGGISGGTAVLVNTMGSASATSKDFATQPINKFRTWLGMVRE